MKKTNFLALASVFIGAAGLMVMAGWIFDIGILKSILPQWISMKFSTALSFFLSGITLFFVVKRRDMDKSVLQVVLSMTTLLLVLIMATLLISSLMGVRTGIEDLFVREETAAAKTLFPGRPSIATMANFIFISMAGILVMFDPKGLNSKLRYLGWVITVIGGLAVAGYVFGLPLFSFEIKNFSNPVALHTAILFVIAGMIMISASRDF